MLSETLKQHRFQLLIVILIFVGLYYRIMSGMVLAWVHDENYSHGFLIPIIAGYFLYTRWTKLKGTEVLPCYKGLAVVLFGLLLLLAGWLGTEFFTMRISLIVLLAGLVLSLLGTAVFRIIFLPLSYLVFMVPLPYIVYDAVAFPLKLFITKVSVATLKMMGVMVFREGNIIMFPATTLEVADACSGMRSLVSLVALATAFAFFQNNTPWRRIVLICSAVPIAIFTNAIRVITTGFLAQHWGAKAAEGFFHEFSGLAVFVVAMCTLVALGAIMGRFGRKPESAMTSGQENTERQKDNEETENGGTGNHDAHSRILLFHFVIISVLLITTGLYLNLHDTIQVPVKKPFEQFPRTISEWNMKNEFTLPDNVQNILKASDVLSRDYVSPEGNRVNIYIGFHGGGKESGEIHSPKQCLPGSGWFEVSNRKKSLDVAGSKINLVQAVYQKGEGKELFIYWFQVREKTIDNEYSLKLTEIINSILFRRRDASFVRVSVPFEADESAALAVGERFVRDFYSSIREFLPK